MAYWVKRITLKDGEVVTEGELREDENRFDGPVPVVGDLIEVQCRGRKFVAEVIWGNWPGRIHSDDAVIPLRVAEVGLDPVTPLRIPRRGVLRQGMDEATAAQIFDDFLARKQAQLGEALTSIAPSPQRLTGGWAFYYQSKSYVLTGDLRCRLVGQGPVVIADEGRLIEGGSLDHNPEELLKR